MGKSLSGIIVIAFSGSLAVARPVVAQSESPVPAPEPAPAPRSESLLKEVGHDLVGFASLDTVKTLSGFGAAALAARRWDAATLEEASEGLKPEAYHVGDASGGMYVQGGAAAAIYAFGKIRGNPRVASLGGDLIRAQIVTQAAVQGLKFAVGRQRPDGSNSLSFPSGHAASAFATATVLQQTFSWRVGFPAFALATFVADSRMAGRKHYLSDVIFGAGIGIAAGRTVTVRLRRAQFALDVAPLPGGAAVMFTKR